MTEDEATQPHEPSGAERAARDRVRHAATGMTYHETAAALEAAEEAAGDLERADEDTAATVAEWRRITGLLIDHGRPYAPHTDAFVQGQMTARENRANADDEE
ncbi:hypothetical protein [Streptomyces sp. H27-S2]|uniref:hypothetical protein n=1 Tax=Streptomyces antarcticus TaxID=2996458 RepID=UPI002270D1CC|nr:hypothetical protein [Streptomyces sp. H27-S2]MCY0949637.1 hypothetical protein [Streptomyces sp. H27-S2]